MFHMKKMSLDLKQVLVIASFLSVATNFLQLMITTFVTSGPKKVYSLAKSVATPK